MFIKNILSWFDALSIHEPEHAPLICSTLTTLAHLLPQLRTVYGGFWGTIIDFLQQGFEVCPLQ